jgi:hypothetical protein
MRVYPSTGQGSKFMIYCMMSPTPFIAASLILPTTLLIYRENPAKHPSLAKNLPKDTAAYIVQQSNCR